MNNKFNSKWGYILASVGSAVGMANIWGFPYKLGANGGFAFLVPYLIFIALFSYVGLTSEFVVGRKYKYGVLRTYEKIYIDNNYKFISKFIGWVPLIAIFLLSIGYAIILAYVLKALIISITGEIQNINTEAWFYSFALTDFSVVWYHAFIIILSLLSLIYGVKSIEKTNKFMMPLFFILFIILSIRVSFLDGSIKGYEFLFVPNWNSLLDTNVWITAMGQAFFSLSIGGSGMLVYGGYISDKEDLIEGARYTAIFDTIAALVAGLVLIPAIFAFNMNPSQGPGMIFVTIPEILQQIPLGRFFAIILFFAILLAGISSIQNLYEALIQSIQYRFDIKNRMPVIFVLGFIAFGLGVFTEPINKFGPAMDLVSIYLIPIGAIIGSISFFWIIKKDELNNELNKGLKNKNFNSWYFIGKYIYVPVTVMLCLYAITFGVSFWY